MARQRDYAAEYQARLARERKRATDEGRPFDRSKARGHKNTAHDRQQARINRLIRNSTGPTSDPPHTHEENMADLRAAIDQARANGVSDNDIEGMLRDKQSAYRQYTRGKAGYGNKRWYGEYQRKSWLPAEFFYYHGQ